MFDTNLTVVGNVVDDPTLRTTNTGSAVANFRLASTARRFDRESEKYIDAGKLFLNVTCWNEMAENVARSLRKGQSIVVMGRLVSREYVKDEQARVSYEITADAIGHNLARGYTEFTKTVRSFALTSVATGDDGLPPDLSEDFLAERPGLDALVGVGAPPF